MSITYNDIVKVNKDIKTKPIKGKEYAECKERIAAFRKLYPEGFIDTSLVSFKEGVCVFHAEVGFYDAMEERHLLGSGTAYEFLAKNANINKTSMIENCETSAVGRALAFCGIGIDAAIASYDEMKKAEKVVSEPQPVNDEERKSAGEEFLGLCQANNLISSYVAAAYGLNGKPTAEQFKDAIDSVKDLLKKDAIPNEWRKAK